jgi:hypothetical protein
LQADRVHEEAVAALIRHDGGSHPEGEDAEADRSPRGVDGTVTRIFDFIAIAFDENREMHCKPRSRDQPCHRGLDYREA